MITSKKRYVITMVLAIAGYGATLGLIILLTEILPADSDASFLLMIGIYFAGFSGVTAFVAWEKERNVLLWIIGCLILPVLPILLVLLSYTKDNDKTWSSHTYEYRD